jgi:hypothetical protein
MTDTGPSFSEGPTADEPIQSAVLEKRDFTHARNPCSLTGLKQGPFFHPEHRYSRYQRAYCKRNKRCIQ